MHLESAWLRLRFPCCCAYTRLIIGPSIVDRLLALDTLFFKCNLLGGSFGYLLE